MFKEIRQEYQNYFRECPKINSSVGRKSTIIKETLYSEFLRTVLLDERIDEQSRLLSGVLASTGLRITEVLHLHRNQIDLAQKKIKGILVQKKRNAEVRIDKPLHPDFIPFLTAFLEKHQGEYLFEGFNRFQAIRRMKKYFGMDCHSWRHSFVNYFLFNNQNQGLERITKIMSWSSFSSAYAYAQNADIDQELANFFKTA